MASRQMHLCIFKKEEEDRKKLISIMCLKEMAKDLVYTNVAESTPSTIGAIFNLSKVQVSR